MCVRVGCSKTLKSLPPPLPAIPEGEPDLRVRGLKSVRAFDEHYTVLQRARCDAMRCDAVRKGARTRDNSRINLPREYRRDIYCRA